MATLFALFLPVMIGCVALGVDYGNLTLQDRKLQKTADLASIIAAADIVKAEEAVAKFFALNNQDIAVETDEGLLLDERYLSADEYIDQQKRGIARLVRGRYYPDPSIATNLRFVAMETSPDAARVTIRKRGDLYFGAMFADPPELSAVGTASAEKLAAFSVGSRLASLNEGILNGLLGGLLGTTISLKAMDYEGLIETDVNVLSFMQTLATRLDLTALTYEEILETDLTLPQMLSTLRLTTGVPAAVQTVLKTLETATSKDDSKIQLERILNLAPKGPLAIATDAPWDMKIGALELITAAAALANGEDQVTVDAGLDLSPLTNLSVKLAIGEPPVGTPSHALAPIGAAVRTAQTRLKVSFEASIDLVVLKTKLRVPLYVEVAHAEARLADIQCSPTAPNGGSVVVDAVPGLLEIALGEVDDSVLSTFSDEARVTPAKMIDVGGLLSVSVEGMAHVETQNMQASRLRFSSSDIQQSRVRNVSTRDLLGSTTDSLLDDLQLEVKVLGGSLLGGTLLNNTLVKGTVRTLLSSLSEPIDELLYNVLMLAGVKIGEADVRVTGVNCERPVLVQ
ncbi:pilus assembly protein TadG-related protein [uncultured Nitratireductor sp.]|uniref:pilus assembly protein TadG-related protein n=1 Tax=uncultured Nitratireductor sp. TaxID=520953 RepID=UPI0025FFDCE1|nr:pilus assembly protein TadG-related protein [uncultured Nitratireductor sp.]